MYIQFLQVNIECLLLWVWSRASMLLVLSCIEKKRNGGKIYMIFLYKPLAWFQQFYLAIIILNAITLLLMIHFLIVLYFFSLFIFPLIWCKTKRKTFTSSWNSLLIITPCPSVPVRCAWWFSRSINLLKFLPRSQIMPPRPINE